ncbi:hypothetical protein ACVBEH_14495 [Roseateles sp. GG27B]
MNMKKIRQFLQQEDLNFLLTNRIPRTALTRLMGWFSQIRNRHVCRASIAIWKLFTDLDLSDARKQQFDSLHDCFTRELLPGARTVDADVGISTSPATPSSVPAERSRGARCSRPKASPIRSPTCSARRRTRRRFRTVCSSRCA